MSEAVTTADTPAPQSVRTNRYARTAIAITVIAFLCNLYLAPLGLFRCLIALFLVPVMLIAGTGFSAVWFLTRKDQNNENPAPQARRRSRFSICWFILWLVIGGSLCWFN